MEVMGAVHTTVFLCLSNSIINSVEQSNSWETNRSLDSQEIPRTPAPIQSQINPVHDPTNFLKTHLNIILPFIPRSSKWSLSLGSIHQNPVRNSPTYVLRAPPN